MKNNNQILKLLTPSWVVNVVGVASGILTVGAIIILSHYESSALRFQIYDVQSRSIVDQQQSIYANITLDQQQTSFIGALPLLLTWACVGLVVYFFATALARSFGRAAAMQEEMHYVHASPHAMRIEALKALVIRTSAAVLWVLFLILTIRVLVPYALASAAAASTSLSLASVGYGLMGVVVLYFSVVLHAIFLRLVLLRPRLFGS